LANHKQTVFEQNRSYSKYQRLPILCFAVHVKLPVLYSPQRFMNKKQKQFCTTGADPARQIRGAILVIFGSKVSIRVH